MTTILPETPTKSKIFSYDIEVFRNFFLLTFYDFQSKEFTHFSFFEHPNEPQMLDVAPILAFLDSLSSNDIITGYNSRFYDNPVLTQFLECKSLSATKAFSDRLIEQPKKGEKSKHNPFTKSFSDSYLDIDLMSLLGLRVSLKVMECHLEMDSIQESPIPFDAIIQEHQIEEIKGYCEHDCLATALLFERPETQDAISVRQTLCEEFPRLKYRDICSYGETTLISSILPSEAKAAGGIDQKQSFRAKADRKTYYGKDFVDYQAFDFQAQELSALLSEVLEFPHSEKPFSRKFRFAGMEITFAQGGLHGTNSSRKSFQATATRKIVDIDVASFYPALISKYEIAPSLWRDFFLPIYEQIRQSRLEAKRNKQKAKANAYKLLLNGTYGKFKSPDSVLYTKSGCLQVAINGELWLLKLIENLSSIPNLEFIQANTDGITCEIDESSLGDFRAITKAWEETSGFELEETEFSSLRFQDVNNYVAIGVDGKIKAKGRFSKSPFKSSGSKIPNVCRIAACRFIANGKDIRESIEAHTNIHDFFVFGKRSGLEFRNANAGKIFRAYFSTSGDTLYRVKEDKKSIEFQGVELATSMDESEIRASLDTERYVQEAQKILDEEKEARKYWKDIPFSEILETYHNLYGDTPFYRDLQASYTIVGDCSTRISQAGKRALLPITQALPATFTFLIQVPENLIVLDLDSPSEFEPQIVPSLVSTYHTSNPLEVLEKRAKGHIWYRNQNGYQGKATIRKGDGKQEKAVAELFGSGEWITLPPSFSTKAKGQYRFLGNPQDLEAFPESLVEWFPPLKVKATATGKPTSSFWQGLDLTAVNKRFHTQLVANRHYPCIHHEETQPSCYLYPDFHFHCFSCGLHISLPEYLASASGYPQTEVWKILEEIKEELRIKPLIIPVIDRGDFSEKFLREVATGDNLEISGATGLGKSYNIAKACVLLQQDVAVVLDTIGQMTRLESIILGIDSQADILKITSGGDTESVAISERNAKIILMQSEYLFEQGHMARGYVAASALENRIVFVDESHSFFSRCEVQEDITGCYRGEAQKRCQKCPKSTREEKRELPCSCVFSGNILPKGQYHQYKLPSHRARAEMEVSIPPEWLDFDSYVSIPDTTLRVKMLWQPHHFEFSDESGVGVGGYYKHLNFLQRNLEGMHLRVELPTENRFPNMACQSIRLCGFNTFPLAQLRQAKQLIFVTATPSLLQTQKLDFTRRVSFEPPNDISKKYPVIYSEIEYLSESALTSLFQQLDEKAFLVTPKDEDSKSLMEKFRRFLPGKKVTRFAQGEYEKSNEDSDKLSDIRLTYFKSSICTGMDMADRSLLIANGRLFVPMAAIGNLEVADTKETIYRKMLVDIEAWIRQLIGRLLRGEIRPIVCLIHGMPAGAVVKLDERVCDIKIVPAKSIASGQARKKIPSLAENLKRGLAGQELVDHSSELEKTVIEHDLSKVSPSKRESLDLEAIKQVREEKKLQEKIELAIEMAKGGSSWREIYTKLHLSRLERGQSEAIRNALKDSLE